MFVDVKFTSDNVSEEIKQNALMVLSTRQGSIPMFRHFGLPMRFLDKPINAAVPILLAEVTEALEQFEPRAKIKDIKTDGLKPVIEITVVGGENI